MNYMIKRLDNGDFQVITEKSRSVESIDDNSVRLNLAEAEICSDLNLDKLYGS